MNINEIRKMGLIKKENLSKNGEDLSKIENILNLLKDDLCFFKININLAIPILLYLGVSEENAKDVYFQLISPRNFKREYEVRTIIGR